MERRRRFKENLKRRRLGKRDLGKLVASPEFVSIDDDVRLNNLPKGYWVYDELLDGLRNTDWVRFAPGFKSALYGRKNSDWCIKVLGMGVGENPLYFCERGYYLEHERRMLETFKKVGCSFQPEVMSQEETIEFLMNECGLTEVQAGLRAMNNDVLVTQYIGGVPFAAQTGHYLDYDLKIDVYDESVLGEMLRSLLELRTQLDAANRNGLVHNDVMPPNIIFTADKGNRIVAKLVDFELAQDLNAQSPDYVNSSVGELYRERNVPVNPSTGKYMKNLDQHLIAEDIGFLDSLIQTRSSMDDIASAFPDVTVTISIPFLQAIGVSFDLNKAIAYGVTKFRSS
jgi:serine/threonine protein kinase